MYYCVVEKLLKNVLDYVERHELLKPGDRVGVAVSGGADSIGLLRLLLALRERLAVVLSVIHFNHKLRGSEAEDDEAFVRQLSHVQGLDFFCEGGDVAAYARKKRLGLEAAARTMRYQYFQRLFETQRLNRIATAHTIDDQAETVLLKLSRGAGTRGLAGIYPQVEFPKQADDQASRQSRCIVRPLLSIRRIEIREYLAHVSQGWREDKSNRDLRHARNRVRHGILPRLERHVNSAVTEALSDTAEIARAEEQYWRGEVLRLLPQVWQFGLQEGGALNLPELSRLQLALQRRVVREAAKSLGVALEFRHVEEIVEIARSRSPARAGTMLPGLWSVSRDKGILHFNRTQAQLKTIGSYEYELSIPGRVKVPELGKLFESVLIAVPTSVAPEQGNFLDPALIGGDLKVRNWRAGDRFWPSHRKSPKKIKELLQEQHVTGSERKLWPVVASGPEVIWMRGFSVPSRLMAGERVERALIIRELPLTEHSSRAPLHEGRGI
ncbi:MAG: tRNA lysidine(34) synthetase TilS [Acidobacteriota bacterium]|nr:tRNA lysidine(34) synthetase TilS [Acidobacteriota bacterium]